MTIKEMKDLGFEMKIPTKDDAEMFISMVTVAPVLVYGQIYEDFCKHIHKDYIGEIIDFAQKFDTALLYQVVDEKLDEDEDIHLINAYYSKISYWRRHGFHLDKIPNKLLEINGKFYRWNSDLQVLVEIVQFMDKEED